jgi:Uroporphyrinogen-III decarboxylase
MNARERVISAFNFKKADRLPRYEIFLPDFIAGWRKKHGGLKDISIYEYYKKIDIGTVLHDQYGPFHLEQKTEKVEGNALYERDSWGRLLLRKKDAFFEKELEVAISEKVKIDDMVFESPQLEERFLKLRNNYERIKERFAPVSGVLGLYMGCSRLRGQEQFLIDMAEDMPFCKHLAEKLMNFTREVGLKAIEATDTWDTALWIYDEFSSRLGPMFSPRIFEKLFLPLYKQMIIYWKSKGLKNIILHCDGNSLPILDMIIDAGFTGIQSLAPTAGMWLPDLRAKYGSKLILIGGMCNMVTLAQGSQKEIDKEARAIIEVAKEGGVVIGTHSIDADIPVDNYDTYYSCLDECDKEW